MSRPGYLVGAGGVGYRSRRYLVGAGGMQSYLLGIRPSTSYTSESSIFLGLWSSRIGRERRTKGPFCSSIEGARDHYSVLGIARNASLTDIKRAYRLLARKYHPDVSKDLKAGEAFKSIRVAYEALSNDAARAQYDHELEFQETTGGSYERNWTYDPEQEYRRRIYRWAELRYRMQNKRHKTGRYYDQSDEYDNSSHHQRGPFSEVLLSASLTLFFTQILGPRLALAMNVFTSLFDTHLDAGYKMGFAVALFLGGRGGVLLTLCISFASWACGKRSSGLVALLVLAMWVGVNVSRFVPFPQGAILAMLYMSMKLKAQPR